MNCPHCRRPLGRAFLRALVARNPEKYMPTETGVPQEPTLVLQTLEDHGKRRVIAAKSPGASTRHR